MKLVEDNNLVLFFVFIRSERHLTIWKRNTKQILVVPYKKQKGHTQVIKTVSTHNERLLCVV